jgi:DNA segregation ATPase FtsK/SpoIIIE-like protein
VRVLQGAEGVMLEFDHPNPRPVSLLTLLPQVQEDEDGNPDPLPLATALLGLTEDGIPLLARLPSAVIRHIFVAGVQDAGKSVLLRSMGLSLLLTHPAEELKLVVVAAEREPLAPLADAPHVVRTAFEDQAGATEIVRSLTRLLKTLRQQGVTQPPTVLVWDGLDAVAADVAPDLQRLTQEGQQAGLHVVFSTAQPLRWFEQGLNIANFGLRLVGKATDRTGRVTICDANGQLLARGHEETVLALQGRGDFLAVGANEAAPLRFKAAYAGCNEARTALRTLPRAPQSLEPASVLHPAGIRR